MLEAPLAHYQRVAHTALGAQMGGKLSSVLLHCMSARQLTSNSRSRAAKQGIQHLPCCLALCTGDPRRQRWSPVLDQQMQLRTACQQLPPPGFGRVPVFRGIVGKEASLKICF